MAEVRNIPAGELPVAHSTGNARLSRTAIAAYIVGDENDPNPINRSDWYDPLDPTLNALFDKMTSVGQHQYGGEPITTLAYRAHGTASTWWIILQYNGYLHQDEIPPGAILQIPDIEPMMTALRLRTSNIGRDVTF